jgi:uncharacterized Rmd1/YagE family protein
VEDALVLFINPERESRVDEVCPPCRSYRLPELLKFLQARKGAYHTDPKQFDEVIYTPYSYKSVLSPLPRVQSLPAFSQTADLLGVPELQQPEILSDGPSHSPGIQKKTRFDKVVEENANAIPEVFLFDYGTVVIWGMTEVEEKRFLASMQVPPLISFTLYSYCIFRKRYEVERLSKEIVVPVTKITYLAFISGRSARH